MKSIPVVFMWRSSSGRATCLTRGAMVGADAIMRRASSFSISWSGASVASTYHIITCSCRAADWSTAKPLPYESRAHLPSVTFYHRFLFFFSFFTSPMFFLLHSPAHLLPPFVPLPHSLRANLPIFKGSRTGPADGPSSAVSAVAVAVSVLHVVQSRCPVASFSFAPVLIVSR